jgi:uncharacterized delta-60 repeat protein
MRRKRCYRRFESKTFFSLAGRACIAFIVFVHGAVARDRYDDGKSVAVQTDGKIVVAGYATVGPAAQIALVRYNVGGSLDKSFNGTGKVITAVGDGDCKGEGLALQSDGKIVVAGYSFNPSGKDRAEFTVLRYNPDGTLDSGFGESGKVTTGIGGNSDSANSVALQEDGKIVVAGYTFAPGNNDFAVARYNANGSLDTSFNGTGKATADFSKLDYGRSVAVQREGKIVVAGDAEHGDGRTFAVARFNANGTPDMSFNKTGKVITDFGGGNAEARGVAVQSDGKIVVAGFASTDGTEKFALVRYNLDGTLDTSFGGTGKVLTLVGMSGSNATAMALQGDGKIVVVGYAVNNSGSDRDFALIRYNADGSLDTRFNGSGKVTTAVSDHDGHCEAVALEKDGKIVAAGWVSSGDNSDFAVVRFGADGKLDTSFNAAGSVLTAVGSKPPEAEDTAPRVSMAVINDPDGYTNVRHYDGKVIAKVKKGERFIAARPWNRSDDPKWNVRLKSGITGFMDKTRIHLLPDEPLMKLNYDARKQEWRKLLSKRVTENDEIASQAKGHGVDYNKTLVRASEGNLKALTQFFSLAQFMDGAAAEGYFPEAWELFHVVGDKTLAKFLRGLPLGDQVGVRGTLIGGLSEETFANAGDVDYLQRYFPETTKLLFRGEIVDWTSPDGRYSIRKTFSDPLDLAESKVSHAELIEKATGQTVCDLTNADIGVGGHREGSVLWSPDSKRFAYVASDLSHPGGIFRTPQPPPQKTQTTVYQLSGNSCVKVDLPLNQPPGQESDREITGALMGHDFVSPTRWQNPNTLILEKHDYYEKLTPSSGEIHQVGRLYNITVSFKEDGTASTSWKLQADR